MQADSDGRTGSQPCRHDAVSGQKYFPSQIYLVGSAKMLATAYKLKCTPLSSCKSSHYHTLEKSRSKEERPAQAIFGQMQTNVPSKLRACALAHNFSPSAHSIFPLAYNRHRSRMLLLTRQANARTVK